MAVVWTAIGRVVGYGIGRTGPLRCLGCGVGAVALAEGGTKRRCGWRSERSAWIHVNGIVIVLYIIIDCI